MSPRRRLRPVGQRAQAISEYILAATVLVLTVVGITGIFLVKAGDFYENVIKVVCLPFP